MKTILLAAALLLALTTAAHAAPDNFALWGYPATPHSDLSQFKNWASVLRREKNMPETYDVHKWRGFLENLSAKAAEDKLNAVNDYFNKLPYHTEGEQYGKYNYWADVQEFLVRGGDCKGYAMAKYFSLLELGYSPDDMAVIVLLDESRNELHAVLAIFQGADILILDNQRKDIVKATAIAWYFPIYAITKGRYWTFQ